MGTRKMAQRNPCKKKVDTLKVSNHSKDSNGGSKGDTQNGTAQPEQEKSGHFVKF